MVTNRNAQAALLITFVAMAGLVVLIAVVFRSPTTNLASEIVKNRDGNEGTSQVVTGDVITLIPDVTLKITGVNWFDSIPLHRSQWRGSKQVKVEPLDSDLRFLVVDYNIENRSDKSLTRKGLSDLMRLADRSGNSVRATELEAVTRSEDHAYEISNIGGLSDMVSGSLHSGSWIFEADFRLGELRLISDDVGFELLVPVGDFGVAD